MRLALLASLALLAACPTSLLAGDFDPLMAKLPARSNVLVLVNAQKMFSCEMAKSEGWLRKYEDNYSKSPLMLPPGAQRFALGADFDLAQMTAITESAAMRVADDLPMPAVARRVRGELETLAGLQAVATPKGAYVVKFAPSLFGVARPADRQRVSRWLRSSGGATSPNLSAYLTEAAGYTESAGTEIILAIDLTDAVSEASIANAMAASPVLADAKIDAAAAAKELAGLRGMTLGIRTTDRATGSLRVDFAAPIPTITPVAKELLLEVLGEAGLAIDGLGSWKLQTAETTFRLSGSMDARGLRRVFSILDLDATGVAAGGERPSDGETVNRYVTQQYFESVKDYLHDLQRETGAKSYYTMARWFEKYARKIDNLPILGVDPELVDYAGTVVGQLRDAGLAIRGAGTRTSSRSAGIQGSSGYNYEYGDNGYNTTIFSGSTYAQGQDAIRDADVQRRAIEKQERAKSSTDAREIMRQVQEETSAIRRKMTQKHGVEF
ncbi:hypothetical protein MalM25_08530 [Planctomycetes bacterium MalM25]|nr:hypothetical protein MalM25_08530 [Planctomycetes bacterium MalM25]